MKKRTGKLLIFYLGITLSGIPLAVSPLLSSVQSEQISSSFINQTRTELAFNKIIVSLNEGKSIHGLLVAIDGEYLVIKAGREETRIPRKNINRLVLEAPLQTGAYIGHGVILGIYGGSLLLSGDRYQTEDVFGYFHTNSLGILLNGALGGAIGGAFGYVASLISSSQAVFEFPWPSKKADQEWERLKNYVTGAASPPSRVHVSLQGGNVFFGPRNAYKGTASDYAYGGKIISFNLMRQIRVTVSILRWLDAGIAVCFLSEPNLLGHCDDYQNRATYSLKETFSSSGYFAVAALRFPPAIKKSYSLTTGLGLGAERFSFSVNGHAGVYSNGQSIPYDYSIHIQKTSPAALAYAEAAVCMGSGLSLGLAAEYVFGPRQSLAALPEAGIPARTIRFSNGSIGFSLGYHF